MRRLALMSLAVAALGVQHARAGEHHVPLDCFSVSLDDMRKSMTLDAAASAAAWAANDLVFIRIQRTGSALGDDYSEPFHLASVTLRMELQ